MFFAKHRVARLFVSCEIGRAHLFRRTRPQRNIDRSSTLHQTTLAAVAECYAAGMHPVCRRVIRLRTGVVVPILLMLSVASAGAQTPDAPSPNTGALNLASGVDVPSVYFFRGMRQEGAPKLTLQPYGTLGIALSDRVKANVGVWDSLNTGTSGTGGPTGELNYEGRFASSLTVGLTRGLSFATTYLAYTSPNASFNTIQEIDLQIAQRGRLAPYALVAFELSDKGQADGGLNKGTYLELGAAPTLFTVFKHARLAVPISVGFSLKNYYELVTSNGTTTDHPFGFVAIGGLVTVPITALSGRFGSWDLHGGINYLALGQTTRAFNKGDGRQVIPLIGVSVRY